MSCVRFSSAPDESAHGLPVRHCGNALPELAEPVSRPLQLLQSLCSVEVFPGSVHTGTVFQRTEVEAAGRCSRREVSFPSFDLGQDLRLKRVEAEAWMVPHQGLCVRQVAE